jgi:hypothetical protein
MSKLQKKPSALKREYQALNNMKFQIFSIFLGHFSVPDPDSEYGSGSIDLIESGSNLDPDPKPCSILYILRPYFFIRGRFSCRPKGKHRPLGEVEGGSGGCIPEEDVDLLPPPPHHEEGDGSRPLLHPPKPAPRKGPSQEVQVSRRARFVPMR